MDNFNAQIFSQPNSSGWQDKIKGFLTVPKIIFTVLGIIVLVELILAVRVFFAPTPLPAPQAKNQTVIKAVRKISLNTAKTAFSLNETIPVSVVIDTGSNEISGMDLIVHFDPKILDASTGAIVKGNIVDEYPLANVDSKKGLISISGIEKEQNTFKGVGQFALINFTAKAAGKTSLTIDFIKGSATASNLVDAATSANILEQVNNLELEIR